MPGKLSQDKGRAEAAGCGSGADIHVYSGPFPVRQDCFAAVKEGVQPAYA